MGRVRAAATPAIAAAGYGGDPGLSTRKVFTGQHPAATILFLMLLVTLTRWSLLLLRWCLDLDGGGFPSQVLIFSYLLSLDARFKSFSFKCSRLDGKVQI
jgi:hypothetical protein